MSICRRSFLTKVAQWAVLFGMTGSSQAAMLTSSVSVTTFFPPITGSNRCSDFSVPAGCSFSGTSDIRGPIEAMEGYASATPSLYAIDLAGFLTGRLSSWSLLADAGVAAELVILGPNDSGFVQYIISGESQVGGDSFIPSFFLVQHGLFPEERHEISPNLPLHQVSLTSQLYPVQFGTPFSFNWAAALRNYGSLGDQMLSERFLRLQLEVLVFDSQERPLTNVIVAETPEPASFTLLATGCGVLVLSLRRLRRSCN